MKKLLALLLALVMVLGLAACSGSGDDEKKGMSEDVLPRKDVTSSVTIPSDFKIGMICLHDENSTYDKNFIDALKSVQKGLGLTDEQVVLVTGIGEDSTCYDTAVDMAKNKGCKVVFADSFGHESFLKQAAQEYPDVQFCHATGTSAKVGGVANLHNAFASIYEGRYLAGVAAGMKLNEMIEEGKITADKAVIGYVGAFTYAEVVSGMTSFFLGARSVCPTATMKVRYTGSWYDQAKEQEAAGIRAKGLAEAEAIEKKAEAQRKMGEASILDMYLQALPEVVKNAASPLAQTDKIVMYGDGNATRVVRDVMNSASQIMEGMRESTGIDIRRVLEQRAALKDEAKPEPEAK